MILNFRNLKGYWIVVPGRSMQRKLGPLDGPAVRKAIQPNLNLER
jgi:hypothetical protein